MTTKTEGRTMKTILEEIQEEDTIKTKTGIFIHNTKMKQNLQIGHHISSVQHRWQKFARSTQKVSSI